MEEGSNMETLECSSCEVEKVYEKKQRVEEIERKDGREKRRYGERQTSGERERQTGSGLIQKKKEKKKINSMENKNEYSNIR